MFVLDNSSLLSGKLLTVFRIYYLREDRKIIQYSSDCAKYDNELSYTLRPGKCHIENREFEIDFSINSAGMRDNESSLDSPEIIVSGDSHAMGWGVNQDMTFSNLLEKKTGRSVLNAAISSYGTVRELKILDRVNLDKLKYLIIQYSSNDISENRKFMENSNTLPVMSEDRYNSIDNNQAYFFGRHFFYMTKMLITEALKTINSPRKIVPLDNRAVSNEVDLFLNALVNSPINVNNINIIVFQVNTSAKNNSQFINKLTEKMLSEQLTHPLAKNINTIDLSEVLGRDKYFHLDDHINNTGHYVIAQALAELITEIADDHIHADRQPAALPAPH